MKVHEDVAFDPGVGAVEVPAVVVALFDDVVDKMNDRLRTIAAGEIDDVGVAVCSAKIITAENAVAARFDAAGAVGRFERRGGAREMTVADDEGGIVERNVLVSGFAEIEMIQIDCSTG